MLFRWLWTSAQLADAGAFGFRNLLFIDSVAAVIVIIVYTGENVLITSRS